MNAKDAQVGDVIYRTDRKTQKRRVTDIDRADDGTILAVIVETVTDVPKNSVRASLSVEALKRFRKEAS